MINNKTSNIRVTCIFNPSIKKNFLLRSNLLMETYFDVGRKHLSAPRRDYACSLNPDPAHGNIPRFVDALTWNFFALDVGQKTSFQTKSIYTKFCTVHFSRKNINLPVFITILYLELLTTSYSHPSGLWNFRILEEISVPYKQCIVNKE